MHQFDTLIDSFIANKIGIDEHFLTDKLANQLRHNLLKLHQYGKMKDAGTSNAHEGVKNTNVRRDKISWLRMEDNNMHELDFFHLIDSLVLYLNETCFTGITGYEFQYTIYESGSFYKKHLDQFRNDSSRKYSMIMYLNSKWKKEDGGELRIHMLHNEQDIAPIMSKCVFFKSDEVEHEVLLSHQLRMGISGWFKVG